MLGRKPSRREENTVEDSRRHEVFKQLDQISEQIREREHEETREKINELFARAKAPDQKRDWRVDQVDINSAGSACLPDTVHICLDRRRAKGNEVGPTSE
jgi:hypothetical protein